MVRALPKRRSSSSARVSDSVRVAWRCAIVCAIVFIAAGAGAGVHASAGNDDSLLAGEPVIGIDLGTTYSVVSLYQNGQTVVIPNEQGNRITPSYVSIDTDGTRLVGDAAKNIASLKPRQTIYSVKRLIGRDFNSKEVTADAKLVPFAIRDKNGKPMIAVPQDAADGETETEKLFAPEEISAMVLSKMKSVAETYYGKPLRHAVITVPAYFNEDQRRATEDAGRIAGLNVVRIINEPTAAALAYGLGIGAGDDTKKAVEKNILVFDLGGGTFDVSVLTIDSGVFEVLATTGDTHLGGDDFDNRLMQHFVKIVKNKYGVDITNDERALAKLRRESEKAKRALSSQHETKLEIEGILGGDRTFSETLTRAKFEELNADLFKRVIAPLQSVLKDAGLKKTQIDEVLLVGGSTRIPKVQQILKDFFNGKELNHGVNPDEAVGIGAAIQGAVLNGEMKKLLLLDVAPLSLGIETVGGVMTPIVKSQTTIPCERSQTFSTYQDDQTEVLIQVYQGERAMCRDNHRLGQFELTGIPKAKRGVPQIKVTFSIDRNGMVTVTAKEEGSGRERKIDINSKKKGLNDEEIARMLDDAKKYEARDNAARAATDARNKLESYAYGVKATIDGDNEAVKTKMSDDDQAAIRMAVNDAIEFVDEHTRRANVGNGDSDPESAEEMAAPFRTKLSQLEAIVNPIFERIGARVGDSGSNSGSGSGDPNADEFAGGDSDSDTHNHDEL